MKTVAILMGGVSEESYLSLRSGENVFKHIDKEKYNVKCVKWCKNGSILETEINSFDKIKNEYSSLKEYLYNFKDSLIFNVLHGEKEGDGRLDGLLEFLNIPYTGNRFYTNFIGMNKFVSKIFFQHLNIKKPEFILINRNNLKLLKKIRFPAIIKPMLSGSSVGIKKVSDVITSVNWIQMLFKEGYEDIIVEEFIEGDDYSVGVLGKFNEKEKQIFPVAKIEYDCEFFDAKCKFENRYYVKIPSGLMSNREKELKKISLKIHEFFKFTGISRTDFIVNENDIYILEVNTHSGLSSHSIIPSMINKSDLTFSEVIDKLINSVML